METKHTPGPWAASKIETEDRWPIIAENNGLIAYVTGQNEQGDEANARLIAAAPDLLAALIDCNEQLKQFIDSGGEEKDDEAESAYQFAFFAIAKAKGEWQ